MDAETIVKMLDEPTDDRRPLVHQLEASASDDALIDALGLSRVSLTRNILCDILGRRHADGAVNELLRVLRDPSPAVRASAADALAKIGDSTSGRALFDALVVEADTGVRQMLVLAIGSVEYREAAGFLMQLLVDADEATRGCAAWSLGELGAKGSKGALLQALTEETGSYAKQRIEEALSKLEPR